MEPEWKRIVHCASLATPAQTASQKLICTMNDLKEQQRVEVTYIFEIHIMLKE